MQCDIQMKAEIDCETLALRSKQLFTALARYNEAPATNGLEFTAKWARAISLSTEVKRAEDEVMVIDGPFIETKELIAG